MLYVSHHSADAELRDEPLVQELLAAEPKRPFYACDVRGIGESRPDTCGSDQFLTPYGSDYFYASHALMLDRPYVGQKTYDVLRVLDWLAALGYARSTWRPRAGAPLPATFAAVLSTAVTQVTLKQAPDVCTQRSPRRATTTGRCRPAARRAGQVRPARLLPGAGSQELTQIEPLGAKGAVHSPP